MTDDPKLNSWAAEKADVPSADELLDELNLEACSPRDAHKRILEELDDEQADVSWGG